MRGWHPGRGPFRGWRLRRLQRATDQTLAAALLDNASGSDALDSQGQIPGTDSAAGADVVSVTAAIPGSDAAAGNDTAALVAQDPLVDAGAGSSGLGTTGSDPAGDVATGVDALGIAAQLDVSDSAAGSDAIDVVPLVDVAIADSALGDDSLAFELGVVQPPVGRTWRAPLYPHRQQPAPADSARGADVIELAAYVSARDSARGVDELEVQRFGPDYSLILLLAA